VRWRLGRGERSSLPSNFNFPLSPNFNLRRSRPQICPAHISRLCTHECCSPCASGTLISAFNLHLTLSIKCSRPAVCLRRPPCGRAAWFGIIEEGPACGELKLANVSRNHRAPHMRNRRTSTTSREDRLSLSSYSGSIFTDLVSTWRAPPQKTLSGKNANRLCTRPFEIPAKIIHNRKSAMFTGSYCFISNERHAEIHCSAGVLACEFRHRPGAGVDTGSPLKPGQMPPQPSRNTPHCQNQEFC
jgi:hypothetical protein